MKHLLSTCLAATFLFQGGCAKPKSFLDPMRHELFLITAKNYDSVIGKFRSDQVSAVLFCDGGDACTKLIDNEYNDIGREMRGMAKIGACNCEEWPAFCKEYGATSYPHVVIFPPHPMPHMTYTGEINKKMIPSLSRHIPSKYVTPLNTTSVFDHFLADQPAVPKVLLFSSKEKSPTLFNALATSMRDRLNFGFVNDDSIAKRYAIKEVPKIAVFRTGKSKKPDIYTGEMKFQPIHEFLNVRSETFVKGGGFSDDDTPAAPVRPWLMDSVPEMTKFSHQDICFKHEALCAIFLKKGNELTNEEREMLEDLREEFSDNAQLRWMWLNVDVEKDYESYFSSQDFPNVVVVKSQKKRFTGLETPPATKESISSLMENILGGFARFKKMGDLPLFTMRKDEL